MTERDGFPPLPESGSNRRWFLALGIGLILLGIVGFGSMVFLELVATLVLGPLLMASGIMQVLLTFFGRRREAPLHLMAAALDLVVGFLVMTHPLTTVDDLILVLAVLLMAGGLYRILSSLLLGFRSWGWIFSSGVVAMTLGLVVWKEGHFRGLWLVGACVALDFIGHGVSWVFLSQSMRPQAPAAGKDSSANADAA